MPVAEIVAPPGAACVEQTSPVRTDEPGPFRTVHDEERLVFVVVARSVRAPQELAVEGDQLIVMGHRGSSCGTAQPGASDSARFRSGQNARLGS